MRTVKVTGKGQIKLRPDMTVIFISLEGMYPEYSDALASSGKDTQVLREVLEPIGFARTDLKTLSFDVDSEYESSNIDGVYRQKFIGYRYRHSMKVEFPSDNDRLGKVLYALANCSLKPEFRISYIVSDREKAKNMMLEKAVADATQKAEMLTKAAGVALKDIQSIDYSWGEISFEAMPMNRALKSEEFRYKAKASLDLDIEPDDIEASDTVTVIWEIA